jgi:hypothetical protein
LPEGVKTYKKTDMKKILLLASACVWTLCTIAQSFNGTIDFKYSTARDTTYNVYIVKDKLVKLDQFGKKSGAVEGSFIFDLNTNGIKFVNPKRKVWGEHKSETPAVVKGKCEVTKGKDSKTIQGIKCTDYTVKNTEENTTITYWISSGERFDFFIPVLKLWNRKDKQSVYFNQITGLPEGSMPMMSEEKSLSDGKILTKLEVVKITKKVPEDASLKVPDDYTKFDK